MRRWGLLGMGIVAGLLLGCGNPEQDEANAFCRAVTTARQAKDRAALDGVRDQVKSMSPSSATVKRGLRSFVQWAELSGQTFDLQRKLDATAEDARAPLETEMATLSKRRATLEEAYLGEIKTLVGKAKATDCQKVE